MAVKKPVKSSRIKSLPRPPIVVVLGHVDHGKTSLLSKLKQQDLTTKEFGGISQHVNAYDISGITFIDTPGHAAFSQMRSRGAKVADLAVLVVAADEGVKPQTLESLKHLQATQTPFLVAINKIDLPNANLALVKAKLAENNILVEGFGGDIVAVPVSAKTGQGLDQLLEMINLLVQMQTLEGGPNGPLAGVVIESGMDPHRGILATVLLRSGQLIAGQELWANDQRAKVKALLAGNGQPILKITAGQAGQVLGFGDVPPVGSWVGEKASTTPAAAANTENPPRRQAKLKVVLKADVAGTLEAILNSLPDEVVVIQADTGLINGSDIELAKTTGAMVIGFNVRLSTKVQKLAEMEAVTVKTYQIIYDLLEDIEKKVLKLMEPTIDETVLGEAEILAEFTINGERIAGSRVTKGRINQKDRLHLRRGEKILGNCRIKSLKIGKVNVEEAKTGDEFGAILSPNLDFVIGDMLRSYQLPAKADGK